MQGLVCNEKDLELCLKSNVRHIFSKGVNEGPVSCMFQVGGRHGGTLRF